MLEKVGNYYFLPILGQLSQLRHGFSTKHFGNMSLSWGPEIEVLNNRHRFVSELGLQNQEFLTFWLTHGSKIAIVKGRTLAQSIRDSKISLSGFDAAVTDQRSLFLLLCSADCLPLIFFDERRGILGVAHAGWRGLVGDLHLKVPKIMDEYFGSQLEDISVGIGPSILSCCNLQKPPLIQEKLPSWSDYLKREEKGLCRVSLVEYCVDSLIRLGVHPENIERSDFCTVDNCGELFSETAVQSGLDKDSMGRFCTVVGMV